jgi:hypothetical protein
MDHASATSPEKQIEVPGDCTTGTATPTPGGATATPRSGTPTPQTGPTLTPTRTPAIGVFTVVPNCGPNVNTVTINWRIDNMAPNTAFQIARNGQVIQTSSLQQGSFVDQIPKGTFEYTLTLPGVVPPKQTVTC